MQMMFDNRQTFQRLNVSISNLNPGSKMLKEIELLKNLPLSLNAAGQDHPLDKGIVSFTIDFFRLFKIVEIL